MPKTKSSYQISGQTVPEIVVQLNFALQRIADRLDKLEGLRGELETQGATFDDDIQANADLFVNDGNGDKIHSME